MTHEILTPIELHRRGIEALVKQLGVANTMRFLKQFNKGQGDYTQERRESLNKMDAREIINRMRAEED